MASISQTPVTTAITLSPLCLPSQNSFYFPSKPPPTTSQPPPQPLTSHILSKPNHLHRCHFSSCTSQFLLSSPLSLTKPQNLESSFPLDSNYHSPQTNTDCLIEVDDLFNLLRLSVKYTDIDLARALHASILKLGEDTHLGNAVIAAYIKLGLVVDAYEVFMGMSTPDVVSYSALISSFSKLNRETEAIQLFFRMRISGIEPNESVLLLF
jgi:pentatricopeptide repeat protein